MKKAKMRVFQERFKTLRGELTQEQFARVLGISRPTVCLYERGERIPDAEMLRDIAEKCEVSADYLVGLTDVKHRNPNIRDSCDLLGIPENVVMLIKTDKAFARMVVELANWKLAFKQS